MPSVGVCTGALLLKLTMAAGHQAEPRLIDFSAAFIVVSLISLSSMRWHKGFAQDVGHELSGHRPPPRPALP